MRFVRFAACLVSTLVLAAPAEAQRNVVVFVADGLRYASVTPETAPTMARLKREGVDFTNSHSVYPTLTTANASAIATGHYLGDTGNYANTLYLKFPVPCRKGAVVTFIEDDCILKDVKALYPNDYIAQTTLIQAARSAGLNTIVVGKKGPAAIQFLAALDSTNESVDGPLGIFIDDSTNHPLNRDGTPTKSTLLGKALGEDFARVTGGLDAPPSSATPNLVQQAYLRQAVTQVLIPRLKQSGKPFAMLYWSRDPDTTQHGARDSHGKLVPGINSHSGRAAIGNADSDLKGILESLKQHGLAANTDVFVIADHGFSTIARGVPGSADLPAGFLARDVAGWLDQPMYDPDRPDTAITDGTMPAWGSALIGPSAEEPQAIVVPNGGSAFIYVPEGPDGRATARLIFAKLVQQPYVGGLFVRDDLMDGGKADFAGALRLSDINLIGSSAMPRPAIVIGMRTFIMPGCKLGPEMCTAQIVDSGMSTGQGMHGSFARADTRNFMAAIGPSFKKGYVAKAPVGNVDVAPTLAHILGVKLTGPGALKGRVIREALTGGAEPKVTKRTLVSDPAPNGVRTLLNVQQVGTTKYFDAGGIPGRTVGLVEK